MPEIICDTSPLQRLHRAKSLELLQSLYEKVVVPEAVAAEIEEGRSQGVSLPDLSTLPWVEVRKVKDPSTVSLSTGLGPAEREALALAMETPGSVLIMDEFLGRRHAKLLRQAVTGTVGVLIKAKKQQLIRRLALSIDMLDGRGFRFLPDCRAAILAWVNESA
jgi:predicted nucleic acid-binding protein